MSFFDDLLKRVTTEDQTILNKYPELKTSVEQLEQERNQAARYAGEWTNWQQQNWDATNGMTKAEVALRNELASAQSRLEAAAAAGSGATDQDVSALRKEFETKIAEVNRQSLAAIDGMNNFYSVVAPKVIAHQKEFGEVFNPNSLLAYIQQTHISDPELAYEKMVSGRRAEIAAQAAKDLEAKHAADIEAARQEGYAKRAQELAMGPNGVMPTDSTGGIAGVTARIDQPAKISDEAQAKIAGAKSGDGSLAQLGYEMYRRGEFNTQVQ
jgi:hypothetical protein